MTQLTKSALEQFLDANKGSECKIVSNEIRWSATVTTKESGENSVASVNDLPDLSSVCAALSGQFSGVSEIEKQPQKMTDGERIVRALETTILAQIVEGMIRVSITCTLDDPGSSEKHEVRYAGQSYPKYHTVESTIQNMIVCLLKYGVDREDQDTTW